MELVEAAWLAVARVVVPDATDNDDKTDERLELWIAAMWRAAFVILWMTAAALWLTIAIGRAS